MGITWENYPPNGEQSELSISVARQITTEFLAKGRGTPSHKAKVDLDKDYPLLNGLIEARLIRMTGTAYFPCFQVLYYMNPAARTVAEDSLGWVFKALRYLYRNKGSNEYSTPEIVEAANMTTSRPIEPETIRLGMLFAIEFLLFFGSWSGDDQQPAKRITVDDRILVFENVEKAWQQEYAQRQPHQPARVSVPVTTIGESGAPMNLSEQPDFAFVNDARLKGIIERDFGELNRIRSVLSIKSRIVIAGGLIEGLLLDALLARSNDAMAAKDAEKEKNGKPKPIEEWRLGSLIKVARELKLISQDAEKHTPTIRDYRNLVHPGREIRERLSVREPVANIADEVLSIVIADLIERSKKVQP
ncbi:MAG: hypothetical protein WBS17_15325 [Candidatus Acidiferrales bacterium]